MKIGRNDPCPCESGKKYKNCCLEKDTFLKNISPKEKVVHHLSYEEVDAYSTEEMIHKLKELGIPFEKETFLQDVETYYSAEDVSENWFKKYQLHLTGRMEDFPWFAAWVLWIRLAPEENLSLEQLSDLVENGYEALETDDPIKASDEWLKFWEAIQYRINRDDKTLADLNEQYKGDFFVRNVVQDLEFTLGQAGQQNPNYYDKRIQFCRSFCEYFPEEELIYHNMRRAIADTYSLLGQYHQAEQEFEQLIEDVPQNPWGYIGLADMLVLDKQEQYSRAKALYKQALLLSNDEKKAVEERLSMLENEK